MHPLPRRALLLPLFLAACGRWEYADRRAAPRPLPPLRYEHLTKLRLNVAAVDVEERFFAGGPGDVSTIAPVPPIVAVQQMARDRLLAMGRTGRAALIVKQASLVQAHGGYDGHIDVELAISDTDGKRLAYAEARVARRQTGGDEMRATLYEMTDQMMDALNVELEFQIRRNLRDWLLPETAPGSQGEPPQGEASPSAVQREELSPPSRR